MKERYIRADLAEIWSEADLFRQIDHLGGTKYRELAGRRTSRVKLLGGVFFLKRHWGVGWGEILKSLASLRLPVLSARNEFEAARALAAVGVAVPEPVAYAVRGVNPARLDSFVLSESIEPSVSLEDLAQRWHSEPPTATRRRRLVIRVAKMVQRMHRAGVNHRDLYICHFLLREPEDQLTLIDLHRAQVRASVPARWLVKDIGALLFSVMEAPIRDRDLLVFVKAYCSNDATIKGQAAQLRFELTDPQRQAFWSQVRRRALALYAEACRKQLVGGTPTVRVDA